MTRSIAPELITGQPATNKVDVYSFGSVLNEIMSDKINYWDLNVNREEVSTEWRRGNPQFYRMVVNGMRPKIAMNIPIGSIEGDC